MADFKTFIEYASEQRILALLIKERVKVALKSKLENTQNNYRNFTEDFENLKISEQVAVLMPTRNWVRPQKKERFVDGVAKSSKQILTRSLALTIKRDKKKQLAKRPAYLNLQKAFIEDIIAEIKSAEPLSFTSIEIMGKKKKVKRENGVTIEIQRPLCLFVNLKEKMLISLMNSYLSEVFDPLLHEEILSYRPLRTYHGNENVITNRDNAMDNLKEYMRYCGKKNIYVAECDIQKFFDSINHDVVKKCFAQLASKLKENHPEFEYEQVERILDAYLNSYSFYKNVLTINEENISKGINKRFEAPKDEDFISRGCYSKEEFESAKERIGIPQGGAISGLIANVVLNAVDNQTVLKKKDCEKFFSRYGDDILLMHTNKEECERLINEYCEALTDSKLLYHELKSVNDEDVRRRGVLLRPAYWDIKSRKPFLWGRSKNKEEDQVDWVGFLGYEIRRTGEIRIRRSSLNDKFKNIKRRYRSGAKTNIAKGKFAGNIEKEIANRIEKFITEGLTSARSLSANKYLNTQTSKLDKYTKKQLANLLYKIHKNNPSALTKEAFQALLNQTLPTLNCYRESVTKG